MGREAKQRRFVVQEHFARTHHYDLRLEKDGVFKSSVLRKPDLCSSGIRRLAILVEDHDLGFGDFEGEIPPGEYGAGKIRIWDHGTFTASRLDNERIAFRLNGRKRYRVYTLVRSGRAGKARWLLMKHSE
jgi:bifunctional non-homologous end joining protein LigD